MKRISELPQPYRRLAELRREQYRSRIPEEMLKDGDDLTYERQTFFWHDSPEGYDFWRSVVDADIACALPPLTEQSLSDIGLGVINTNRTITK